MSNWRKFSVRESMTIEQVIRHIEFSAEGAVIVVDEYDCLKGLITDGDVRRAILAGHSLNDSAASIMTKNPLTVLEGTAAHVIKEMMRSKVLSHMPIVSADGRVVGIEVMSDLFFHQYHDYPVVLMAGGLGTRLGELTKDCPKPLLKINDKPILEIMIERLKNQGFSNIFISVNYRAEMVEGYFGDGSKHGVQIQYLREPKRLGTAGALALLPQDQTRPILMMNGDLLTEVNFTKLIDFHEVRLFDVTVGLFRHEIQIPFGVVKLNSEGRLKSIKEKPTKSYLVNAGIYVINPDVASLVPRDEYFDMNMLLGAALDANHVAGGFPIHEYWIDIGRTQDLERARNEASRC